MTNPEFNMESLKSEMNSTDNLVIDIGKAKIRSKEIVKIFEDQYKTISWELSDILHIIELADISWWSKILAYKSLLDVLLRRRAIKDSLSLATKYRDKLNAMKDYSKYVNMSQWVQEYENASEKRGYHFRVLLQYGKVLKAGDKIKLQ